MSFTGFTEEQQGELDDLSRRVGNWVDKGYRHKTGATMKDALAHWIDVARVYAYATQDGTWAEFEKEFTIIVQRMVRAERKLEMLGAEKE